MHGLNGLGRGSRLERTIFAGMNIIVALTIATFKASLVVLVLHAWQIQFKANTDGHHLLDVLARNHAVYDDERLSHARLVLRAASEVHIRS